jgi:hypothetical protein
MESEPVAQEPVPQEPVTQEQNQVIVEAPVSQEQNQVIVEEPVPQEPVAQEPVQNQVIVEEPVAQEQNQVIVEEPVAQEQNQVIVEEPVAQEQNQVIVEEPVTQEPVLQEPVAQEPVTQEPVSQEPVAQEPVTQEPVSQEPVAQEQEVETEAPVAETQVVEAVEEQQPEIIIPTTHEEIDSLNLFFIMKHYLSERLLIRAMHALLDVVVPDAWSWAANVDITNVNEGVDPMFDAIQHHMNEQTDFKRDVTWELRKNAFVWIIRQLNYIAKHGVPQYKTLYANYNPMMDIEGLWVQHEAGI